MLRTFLPKTGLRIWADQGGYLAEINSEEEIAVEDAMGMVLHMLVTNISVVFTLEVTFVSSRCKRKCFDF